MLFGKRHHNKKVVNSLVYSDAVNLADALRFVLLFVVCLYTTMMFALDVGDTAEPVEIHVRNWSSIAALFVLAVFFDLYYKVHKTENKRIKYMKLLKNVSIFLVVAGVIKILISLYYFVVCFVNGNFVMLFYIGEILAWLAIALFGLFYYKKLQN